MHNAQAVGEYPRVEFSGADDNLVPVPVYRLVESRSQSVDDPIGLLARL